MGWLIAGVIIGGSAIYAATRKEKEQLREQNAQLLEENAQLLRHIDQLNLEIHTFDGQVKTLKNYLLEKDKIISSHEGNMDATIGELNDLMTKIQDAEVKQLLKEMIERAKKRKTAMVAYR